MKTFIIIGFLFSVSLLNSLKIEVYFDELVNDSDQVVSFKFISAQKISRIKEACFVKIMCNNRKKLILIRTYFDEREGEVFASLKFQSGLLPILLWEDYVEKYELLQFKFALRYDGIKFDPALERIDDGNRVSMFSNRLKFSILPLEDLLNRSLSVV